MRAYASKVDHFSHEGTIIVRGVLTEQDPGPLTAQREALVDKRARKMYTAETPHQAYHVNSNLPILYTAEAKK